jgi:uncharacterized protein YifE (UPF0438 family)
MFTYRHRHHKANFISMTKNICAEPSCRNYERYCRLHLADEDTPQESREKVYLKVRKKFLEKNPVCDFEGCWKKSTEVHHKKGRIGKLLTDDKHFMAVCPAHHRWIEKNPHSAKEKGYSESRLKK